MFLIILKRMFGYCQVCNIGVLSLTPSQLSQIVWPIIYHIIYYVVLLYSSFYAFSHPMISLMVFFVNTQTFHCIALTTYINNDNILITKAKYACDTITFTFESLSTFPFICLMHESLYELTLVCQSHVLFTFIYFVFREANIDKFVI